jgi:Family of unknown function (DUF5681)
VSKKSTKRGKSPGSAATQFGEGRSGNTKGRPKGSPNRNAIIRKVLSQVVTGDVGGKKKKVTVTVASVLRLSQMALQGNIAAIKEVLRLWKESTDELEAERENQFPFGEADRNVIAAMHARMKASEKA